MIRRPPRSTRTDTLFPDTTLCRSRFVESKEDAVAADLLHCFDYGGGLARPCNRFNNGVACARFNESKDGSLEAAPAGCGVHLVEDVTEPFVGLHLANV